MSAFISYSRQDSGFVDRLTRDLNEAGVSVWLDRLEIDPGDRIVDAIGVALASCDVLLLILTEVSADSPWVRHEWNTWMALQFEEERQAEQADKPVRRRLVPVVLGDSDVPPFLRGLAYIRIGRDEVGYRDGLKEILKFLKKRRLESLRRGFRDPSGEDSEDRVGEFKLASNLLRGLLDSQFERILPILDPQGLVRPSRSGANRARLVEELIHLMIQRGPPSVLALQEAVLAVRSPFSPFDGKTLENWVGCPPDCWQAANSQIVGAGNDPLIFSNPDTPTDLQYASLLTWEGLTFRDGYATAKIWAPLIGRGGAGGMVLRAVKDRSGLFALLRQTEPHQPLTLELWQREATLLILVQSVACPADMLIAGLCELTFHVDRERAIVSADSNICSDNASALINVPLPLAQGPGHFGFVKFGSGAVGFTEPELTVHTRMKSFPKLPSAEGGKKLPTTNYHYRQEEANHGT